MIIHSLLDTDLYKLTMQQVVLHQFPDANVKYKFKCRNQGVNLAQYADEIESEIRAFCNLRFKADELSYLRKLRFMKPDYVDFLKLIQLDDKYVKVAPIYETGELDIIIEGPWLHTILFEVPVLAIVNEVYFSHESDLDKCWKEGNERLDEKLQFVESNLHFEGWANKFDFAYSEFGTRRRYSRMWHESMIRELAKRKPPGFAGTSNVWMAYAFDLPCHGTMAHEYIEAMQVYVRLAYSQKHAFECWAKEYRGDLGIALSDTFGLDAFLRDFDLYFCKLFDGARHDSGDPAGWASKMIAHYKKHKVDPRTKRLVFSDGLTMKSAVNLYKLFQGEAVMGFGIGTHLTNDMGVKPLNVVMKPVQVNGQPVIKVSDSPGKSMCEDPSYEAYVRKVFGIV